MEDLNFLQKSFSLQSLMAVIVSREPIGMVMIVLSISLANGDLGLIIKRGNLRVGEWIE